jgi:oxygen-independent coproporphyrinogen III oxidase
LDLIHQTTLILDSLIKKYNTASPRYTSYPTVPFWDATTFTETAWLDSLIDTYTKSNRVNGISLYIHLPYCESLCTFCGCNKRITKNHSVELPYIQGLLKEWQLYFNQFPDKPLISEIHLGGGTPSFFNPDHLEMLISGILKEVDLSENFEFSFEGHPNNTTYVHLSKLYELGFRRVSFGVQDYDETVQKAIHRIQPFENVKNVTEWSREIGYKSVSHDLVFGLPFQQKSSIYNTIEQTLTLQPDRIAFYSYAHVPWIKGSGQRGFDDNNLPDGDEKRELYELGRSLFEANNYSEIGMDHFALAHDSLYLAQKNGTLNRNFMGYTTTHTRVLLGLGVSAISDSWTGFAQNNKNIDEYLVAVNENKFPVVKGHILTNEDVRMRQQILNIMCNFSTKWDENDFTVDERIVLLQTLENFRQDGILNYTKNSLEVTALGIPFVRNICTAFDKRMLKEQWTGQLFSKSI